LRGSEGALDIYCVYLDTKSSSNRQQSIRTISNSLQPKTLATSIICGDFNYVDNLEDRWNIAAGTYSGTNNDNAHDAKLFKDLISTPFDFCEWEQPYFTCNAGGAKSRIDRMYINQHVSYQLDHNCSTSALEWDLELSRHRPIVFSRLSHKNRPPENRPLQAHVFKRKGWAQDVCAAFQLKCAQDHISSSACRRLVLLKDAIREESNNYNPNEYEEGSCTLESSKNTLDDSLGHTMAALKCISLRSFQRADRCIASDPSLRALVPTPMNLNNIGDAVHKLREHAVALSREIIHRDANHLVNTPPEDPEEKQRAKDNILKQIKRLSPGESSSINAMINKDSQVVTSPEDIAAVLRDHWGGVFKEKQIEINALQIWMEELFVSDERGLHVTGLPDKASSNWVIRRKTVAAAVRSAKASMPGPDGIPASAYQMLGDIAVDILHDAILALSSPEGLDELISAYSDRSPPNTHDFNLSLLCCLPKKAAGHDPAAGEFFSGENTRPLALVNTDNRIMASAARLTWEPILSNYISLMQQGFLKGRQMLGNVIDIDFHSMRVSLTKPSGAVVFFDFKAAFPSVSHRFLRQSLHSIGLPDHALAFIDSLYSHNNCDISLKGNTYKGFGMFCGIRQGCPISPLLFAAAVDVLLRRLQQKIPNGILRAFADDIGMVMEEWERDSRIAQSIFKEFAKMSGLELNLPKTVVVPLWPKGVNDMQQQKTEGNFSWDPIQVAKSGKYLGFSSGPGRGNSSWDAAAQKYLKRTRKWQESGSGTQFATLAYNTFAFTTLCFIAQLEHPPPHVTALEQQGLRNMLPGPGNWFVEEDAFFFKECYGQARSFHSLGIVSRAAKLRVLHTHNTSRRSGLVPNKMSIHDMYSKLQYYLCRPIELDRIVEWGAWYSGAYAACLAQNETSLLGLDISLPSCLQAIAGGPSPWNAKQKGNQKRELQKYITNKLKHALLPDAVERIRHKIGRWMDPLACGPSDRQSARWLIVGPPAHVARRVHVTLQRLSSLVPPRVASAMLHTLWNGWCTARRFQEHSPDHNRCWLGCGGNAQDSIEHYCRCPVSRGVLKHRLRIEACPQQALPLWLLSHHCHWDDEVLALVALFIYAVYMATNHYRHTHIVNTSRSAEAIRQHIIQGCQGNARLVQWVQDRWRSPMLVVS